MVEHDDQVGVLLDLLDELGIADNTIIMYSTDNGAETVTWPDGGTTPFHGEKGTTWEGGFRVPLLVKWPGLIEPGSKFNDIVSHEDWMPTVAAALGEETLVEDLKEGKSFNGKEFRVHLDGYDLTDYLSGTTDESPRNSIFYFDQGANLNAVRVGDFKAHFATLEGDITKAVRNVPSWPQVTNLKADPYEKALNESKMYLRWYAENTMWIFVPIQAAIKEFLGSIPDYPFQLGSSLSASNISYQTLVTQDALQRLRELESIMPGSRQ